MMRNHIGKSTKDGVLATAGVFGAVGASSCCVLPLALAVAGISGAWIGWLTKLAPYQPVFLAIGGLSIGFGLWRSYRGRAAACEGPQCGTPASRRVTKATLWVAAALLLIAASTAWWAPLIA
ncbi:MAG: mercuric transporter MerT family protein [Dongiaceae bacterium]